MNRNVAWIVIVAAIVTLSLANHASAGFGWHGQNEGSVCYRVSSAGQSDGNIFRLDVEHQGALTTFKEEWRLGHPRQKVYSVNGKVVPRQGLMGTATGTVVVVKGEGARMGLQRNSVGLGEFYSILDCTTSEPYAIPDEWPTCSVLLIRPTGTQLLQGTSLTRVDPLDEPLCSNYNVDVRR